LRRKQSPFETEQRSHGVLVVPAAVGFDDLQQSFRRGRPGGRLQQPGEKENGNNHVSTISRDAPGGGGREGVLHSAPTHVPAMNPDVASAVRALGEREVLGDEQGRHLLRLAEGKLVSVHHELRLLLYAGVALVVAGVGALVHENLERLGPVVAAAAIGLVAASCFVWIFRKAPPFSWGEGPSTHVAFDYVLLLAVLLLSADVAYVEAQFTPLGPDWPWHLLFMSLFMGAVSVRFDSRMVYSLALSTFASWRGVSISLLEGGFWSSFATAARLNTAFVGLVFVVFGLYHLRSRRKPHFEPVATYLGWLLVLLSLGSGAMTDEPSWGVYCAGLLLAGCGLGLVSYRRGRFPLFAMSAASAYAALGRFVVPVLDDDTLVFLWFAATSIGAILALVRAHRALGREA
jgi:hypothetical protein